MTAGSPDIEESNLGCFVDPNAPMTECFTEGLFAAGPSPSLIGLMLSGALLTSLYIAGDGDAVVPAVITILLGGAMVPILPPQYVTLAYTVAVVGTAVAIFAAWNRFTSPTGFQ